MTEEKLNKIIGKNIQKFREENNNISLEELSKKTEIDLQVLYDIETANIENIKPFYIYKLSTYFDITIDKFILE